MKLVDMTLLSWLPYHQYLGETGDWPEGRISRRCFRFSPRKGYSTGYLIYRMIYSRVIVRCIIHMWLEVIIQWHLLLPNKPLSQSFGASPVLTIFFLLPTIWVLCNHLNSYNTLQLEPIYLCLRQPY